MEKIDQNTTLKEILQIEGAQEILMRHNIPCLFCPMASFEIENLKIGDVCRIYGIDSKKLLEELNKFLKGRRSKK
jgi:hypothetical protein